MADTIHISRQQQGQVIKAKIIELVEGSDERLQGAVALTVGSVSRRIVTPFSLVVENEQRMKLA